MAAITISAQPMRPAARRPRPVPSSAARAATPVRLTLRGRRLLRTVVVAVALLVVLVVGFLGRTPAGAGDSAPQTATSTVVVQPGDTLWNVAKSVAPNADVRETVERIATLNNLDTRVLIPGQTLVIPAAG